MAGRAESGFEFRPTNQQTLLVGGQFWGGDFESATGKPINRFETAINHILWFMRFFQLENHDFFAFAAQETEPVVIDTHHMTFHIQTCPPTHV